MKRTKAMSYNFAFFNLGCYKRRGEGKKRCSTVY